MTARALDEDRLRAIVREELEAALRPLVESKAPTKPARRKARKPVDPTPEDHAHVARLLRRRGLAR